MLQSVAFLPKFVGLDNSKYLNEQILQLCEEMKKQGLERSFEHPGLL